MTIGFAHCVRRESLPSQLVVVVYAHFTAVSLFLPVVSYYLGATARTCFRLSEEVGVPIS